MRPRDVARGALLLGGAALLLGKGDLPGPPWTLALVAGAFVALALLARAVETRAVEAHGGPLGWWLWPITVGGIYLTVPDTEEILLVAPIAATVLAVGVLIRPIRPLLRLDNPAGYAAIGLTLWASAWGARGREGALVGAVMCFGWLLVEPLARSGSLAASPWRTAAGHLAIVLWMSRVAGMRTSPIEAAGLAVLGWLVALAATSRGSRGDSRKLES